MHAINWHMMNFFRLLGNIYLEIKINLGKLRRLTLLRFLPTDHPLMRKPVSESTWTMKDEFLTPNRPTAAERERSRQTLAKIRAEENAS